MMAAKAGRTWSKSDGRPLEALFTTFFRPMVREVIRAEIGTEEVEDEREKIHNVSVE